MGVGVWVRVQSLRCGVWSSGEGSEFGKWGLGSGDWGLVCGI